MTLTNIAKALTIGAIVATIATGVFLFWRHPQMPASISKQAFAVPPISTKNVHIQGCDNEFADSKVEPRVLPGATLDEIREIYGNETKKEDYGGYTWNLSGFTLQTFPLEKTDKQTDFLIVTNQDHKVATLDGIVLGKDTFASILKAAKARGIQVHERMDGPEGNWALYVSFPSACSGKFISEYSWMIPGSTEVNKQIIPDPDNGSAPWRSDIFLDKIAVKYTVELADRYQSDEGSASIHTDTSSDATNAPHTKP